MKLDVFALESEPKVHLVSPESDRRGQAAGNSTLAMLWRHVFRCWYDIKSPPPALLTPPPPPPISAPYDLILLRSRTPARGLRRSAEPPRRRDLCWSNSLSLHFIIGYKFVGFVLFVLSSLAMLPGAFDMQQPRVFNSNPLGSFFLGIHLLHKCHCSVSIGTNVERLD